MVLRQFLHSGPLTGSYLLSSGSKSVGAVADAVETAA
jgi:hypothetical protein